MPRFLLTACFALFAGPAFAQTNLLPADRPIEQVVDHYIAATLKTEKIQPAPVVDDAAFLRRLTLDLVGRIPTPEETQTYLGNSEPDKKAKAVERLMASPGYVRHQSMELFALLQLQEVAGRAPKKTPLYNYLLAAVGEKRSWDRIFRELMLPDDNAKNAGANEFLRSRVKDLNRLTIDTSSLFFGVNVSCAQCHDHPHVETWTQDHFYGMKAFLARTVESGGFVGEKDFGVVKYIPNKGKEKIAPVMFLTGKTIMDPGQKDPSGEQKKKEQQRLDEAKKSKKAPAPPEFSIRAKLVETALEPGQGDFFARSIANRVFHRFHGRGLVMPLDQMHLANPASHPDLLAWLTRDVMSHGYDLNRLTRGLVLSETYARSSRFEGESFPQDRFFAVGQVRALTPVQMAASMKIATADPQSLLRSTKSGPDFETRIDNLEKKSTKWIDLFPQPGDSFQVGVSEAMLFANNEGLSKELLDGQESLAGRLKTIPGLEEKAELAVRSVLSRPARPDETQALADYLRRRQDRIESATQQMIWALVTSAEFRFNH